MPNIADAEHVKSRGYVLGADDGERLTNPSGEVIFKVDPSRGSDNLSLGTQQVPPGAGIPRHRHAYMDIRAPNFSCCSQQRRPDRRTIPVRIPADQANHPSI